jgi:hypothetical protein
VLITLVLPQDLATVTARVKLEDIALPKAKTLLTEVERDRLVDVALV